MAVTHLQAKPAEVNSLRLMGVVSQIRFDSVIYCALPSLLNTKRHSLSTFLLLHASQVLVFSQPAGTLIVIPILFTS